MAPTERKRTVRSVTLDDDLVEQAKAAGLKLVPKETNLSRIIDRALAEFVGHYAKSRDRKGK